MSKLVDAKVHRYVPKCRAGKLGVVAYLTPRQKQVLVDLAKHQERTINDLAYEAFSLLFDRYWRPDRES